MQRNYQSQPRSYKKFSRPKKKKNNSYLVEKIHALSYRQQAKTEGSEEMYDTTHTFKDFPFTTQLQNNIRQQNYVNPTPIQDQTIPHILTGKDVIGIANTGTGKTAAFLLPLIDKVIKNRNERIIIMTPTRELALQIHTEFKRFTQGTGVRAVLCYGGTDKYKQIGLLKNNPQFVIGTPGRLKDLIRSNVLHLSQFNTVVLDEADRMVDIGFITDIKYFISLLPKNRQSLCFSATISPKIEEILQLLTHNPVTISVKQHEVTENIHQSIIKVERQQVKLDLLHDLLSKDDYKKVLVFGKTKRGVQRLADELSKRGHRAGAIHGDKRQYQRQRTLEQFRTDRISILLATDVASRGLDIQDVSHVINYDLPESYEDYIHRIGRTGRANQKGTAITFVE